MATLILSAVGTMIGGPLGGALGALIGQQFDSALIGRRKVEGPRLKELSVQTSSYGSAIPLHFGTIRAAGSVIWATELVEHEERSGGGKGRPSVTSYSYTASFAVAISSRSIAGIGRVWADGNLMRGAAGDLKVGGTMRVHTGHGDQQPDTLLAQAESDTLCPAYRNTAYVVFEDLQLAGYGNRLPSLTFEVIADSDGISVADICNNLLDDVDTTDLSQAKLAGFTVDQGTAADVLPVIAEISPLTCSVRNERLTLGFADVGETSGLPMLPPPCAGGETAEDARQDGWSRRREAMPTSQQCAVRYYDIARDYQPGLQRSIGRSAPGDVTTIDLPATMTAQEASIVADRAARRRTQARETLRYRITEVDANFAPGVCLTTPVADGIWRVEQWEWQADGVMLDLVAVASTAPLAELADAGRVNSAPDLVAVPSQIVAMELPWDGAGDGTTPIIRVATTAESAGWTGASLYAEHSDGTLYPLGSTGRRRAAVGTTLTPLGPASPLLLDRASIVDIELAASDLALANATWAQLMQGANLALLGSELVQFARAERISDKTWRLSALLRGRGGTEHSIAGHLAGEPFAMIAYPLGSIDNADLGATPPNAIIAIGLGDNDPARSAIVNAGLTLRPLSPVHGTALLMADGSLHLQWVRRARGAWNWRDDVDVPLNEAEELWEISFGSTDGPTQIWRTGSNSLEITAPLAQSLLQSASPQPDSSKFAVRQIGQRSKSLPLIIALPA
jgi:hypothetical protein